ncbi:MAG: linear amide C-N hydrolase [Clostridiales bacterium]|nr:linear amide C-N hydrolase [Clostridiales bacterium]
MCTAFFINKNPAVLSGQNYDFYYAHGLIVTNMRGLMKEGLSNAGGASVSWTSRYGNITLCQFGRELPICGMNEKGLAVSMLYHEDGEFPQAYHNASLNELQWIQYQLDCHASVDEVIAKMHHVKPEKSMYTLHYMLADSSGKCVFVEFIQGKPVISEHTDYAVLTNTSYEPSQAYARQYTSVPTNKLPRTVTSLDRFTLASRLAVELFKKPGSLSIDGAFKLLNEVSIKPTLKSLLNWIGTKIPPTFTAWSVVFDLQNRKICYTDQKNQKIRYFSLDDFDFDVKRPVLSIILDNQLEGDIHSAFTPYRTSDNARIINISYKPIKAQFPAEMQNELIRYPDSFKKVSN